MMVVDAIGSRVDYLMNMRLNLSEILGQDWLDRCTYPDLDSAFRDIGSENFFPEEDSPEIQVDEKLRVIVEKLNSFFNENGGKYKAKVFMDCSGENRVLITGSIGTDTIIQIATLIVQPNDRSIFWELDAYAIVGTKGVFRIDQMLNQGERSGKEVGLIFAEIPGRSFTDPHHRSNVESEHVVTYNPTDYVGMGVFLHELGHLVRQIVPSITQGTKDVKWLARKENELSGSDDAKPRQLSPYEARKITADEERGAWALGLSIMRSAGRRIGASCASSEAMKIMSGLAEQSLLTYDDIPYNLAKNLPRKPIPAFSNSRRQSARELHQLAQARNLPYSSMPSFDDETGEDISGNPQQIIEKL